MSSLLDQFNSHSAQSQPEYPVASEPVRNSGYISMNQEVAKDPIFKKRKMNISFPHNICHMAICNEQLVLIMANNAVYRMNLNDVNQFDEINLDQYIPGLKIENMFLDPTGAHLLMSLTPKSPQFAAELMYLHRTQKRPKKMDKFKDHEVTAVAFNHENSSTATTGPILLGTSKGLIFESEFAMEADRAVQNNWRQVFDIGRNERIPITGLEYFRVPGSHKYIVLAASPDHLYKFTETVRPDERSPFQAIFRGYTLETTEFLKTSSQRFTPSSASTPLMRLCYDSSNHFVHSFAILTAHDLLYTELDASANTHANIVASSQVPFPERESGDGQKSRSVSPVAYALTRFHAVLVYPDHLVAISLLDYSVAYEEFFSERLGSLLNVVSDVKADALYVYTTKTIFRVTVTHERRFVWKIYMDLGRLEEALQFAGDNPRNRDIVLSRTAETKFNSGLYLEAAATYAETMASFETVCLKFLELGEVEALRVFLRKKMATLPAQDKTQITMLVVWLVELYLAEMVQRGADTAPLQREFEEFMRMERVQECVRKNTRVFYDLMASHGDCTNLAALTAGNNDFEAVVAQLIHQQKWQEALRVLRTQKRPELFYRFAPILMEAVPRETVAALMEQREALEAGKLLPTLICLGDDGGGGGGAVREVVQYLEFAIHSLGTTEMALHNYLVRLFAEHSRDKLLPYLETQGKDVTQLHYDRQYALRVCKQWQCHEACVFLLCLLGLWTEAVELALRTGNVQLAQEKANLPAEVEVRRKLWLRIAEHQIKERQGGQDVEQDVEGALQLLKQCDLLRIEDILPHFRDFERIDHFKVAICEALQDYNQRIQEQKKDMAEAERAAERVRKELQMFRERSLTIAGDDLCGACATFVLLRPCFVFPCGHKFHGDCLERELLLVSKEGGRLSILRQRMAAAEGTKEFARHRADYEDLLAGECLYCGQLMIEAIDQPFVDDWERVNSDWA